MQKERAAREYRRRGEQRGQEEHLHKETDVIIILKEHLNDNFVFLLSIKTSLRYTFVLFRLDKAALREYNPNMSRSRTRRRGGSTP